MDKSKKKHSKNLTQDELRRIMKTKQKSKGSLIRTNKRPSSSVILSKEAKRTKEEFDRKSYEQKIIVLKKHKLKLQKMKESSIVKSKEPKSILSKTSLVAGYASSSSDSEMEITTKFKTPTQANVKSSNFSSQNNKECILPEGFFDDEDIDARVQGKDTPMEKLDKEYELFQHEMKIDNQKIEDIKDEEHEKIYIDRSINEIDEQLENYKKLLSHMKKKDEIFKSQHQMEIDIGESSSTDGGSSSDEEFDWRDQKLFS